MTEHEGCKELLGELSDYIDGVANEAICAAIEAHLTDCPDCKIVIDTMKKTITLYRGQDAQILLPADVRDRLYQTLDLMDYLPPSTVEK